MGEMREAKVLRRISPRYEPPEKSGNGSLHLAGVAEWLLKAETADRRVEKGAEKLPVPKGRAGRLQNLKHPGILDILHGKAD